METKFLVLAIAIALGAVACEGPVPHVARNDGRAPQAAFSSIRVDGPSNVYVAVGQPYAVQVNCDESDIAQRIRTRVDSGTLVIVSEWDGAQLWPVRACTVNIALPALASIEARGSGDFAVGGYADGLGRIINEGTGNVSVQGVRGSHVELHATNAGNVKIGTIEATAVSAELTGAGQMKLAGRAKTLRIHTTGRGGIDASDLRAEVASVDGAGSGDIQLFASQRADVQSSGAGDVTVLGHPTDKRAQRAGTGSVHWE